MPLVSLGLHNFRVYERAQLDPSPHLNLITGANASGKTSLLEAIHLLGTGRSYRTASTEQLQRNGTQGFSVVGLLQQTGGETTRLGVGYALNERKFSVNGLEQRRVSSLALHLPVQVISPDTHYEFQQSAKHRRGVLDWGLFHVEQDFHGLWTRYQRTLHQRNAALKDELQKGARHVWDEELIETGEKLHAARAGLITRLHPLYQTCCQQLLPEVRTVELVLEPGWEDGGGFADALQRDQARDYARGFTHSGPQRADLQIRLDSRSSKQMASHGQYKLLIVALRLAQILYLLESRKRSCCLLIDDLAAELDVQHRARLSQVLVGMPIQVFVTATESTLIDRASWPTHKEFHVEHGEVKSL